jgi:hypothetical protein
MFYKEDIDSEVCHPLDYFLNDPDYEGKILFEMQRLKKQDGYGMFCGLYGDFVERGCNDGCREYKPCNGKSGKCRNSSLPFEDTGRRFLLLNNKLIEVNGGNT